jgi:four helix bundle protein
MSEILSNKEFAKKLEERTESFAISIIKLSSKVNDTLESRVLRRQIVKSGTSIGANYREANRSRSKPDFISRIRICEAEASETVYWLRLFEKSNLASTDIVQPILMEAKELLAIFTSINNSLRNS